MANTISDGIITVTPTIIDGYRASARSNNIVRQVVGSSEPAVSFRAAGLRTGSLVCIFETSDDAHDLYALLLEGDQLTFASSDRPEIGMDFVTGDSVDITLDDSTRSVWVVSFDWQEV